MIMNKRYVVAFLLIQFLLPKVLFADSGPITKYLGIEQGLSNNSVRCIYQDHNGFIWFGTFDGLNRYNGYEFKIFRNKSYDSTSLPYNYINTMSEDHHKNLWIGTGKGIGIYNNLTSKFDPAFYIPFGTQRKEKIEHYINAIKADAKGNVFMATNEGLLVQLEGSLTAFQLPCVKDAKGICRKDFLSIVIDKKQRIWLSVNGLGLCLYDEVTKKIKVINNKVKNIRCMETDDGEHLWLGTGNGVYQYNIITNSLVRSYDAAPGKLTSNAILSLCFDRQHQLWIGTEGGGINILDPASGKIRHLLPGESKNALSSEMVNAIYEDQEGRKWIGTQKGGINIIDPRQNRFQNITHDPFNPNSLINNFVTAFYEDRDRNLWIGTDGGGMSIWDRRQNKFTNFRHEPGNPQSLGNNTVPCFKEDYLNDMWIATFGSGINKFNRATGTFERFKCVNELTGEENKYVWLLYEDRDKNFWAATFSDGKLYRLNRPAARFEVFSQKLNNIYSLVEDRTGILWAGSPDGLTRIDKQNKRHVIYKIGKAVRAILEDKKGNFWIGTEGGGLILFDRAPGKIKARFTDAHGLCNNSVLNILEDDMGHLWLSTFNGLSEFDPTRKTFKNYYHDDGLQSNQFLYNAALRLQSGELAFGGIRGFNIFHPDSIRVHNEHPPVFITGLRINNQPVIAGSPYVTGTSGDQIKALKIPYDEAVLFFEFAALEYSAPGKVSYAYYLEGWDKGWNYSGNIRTANYTHLREGNYVLHIKSTTADGAWNPREVLLDIKVLSPWYRSWWAYILYLLMAGGAVIGYQRYKARQAKLEYEVALAQVSTEKEKMERERAEVESQMKQVELEAERAEREKREAELAREKAEREKGQAELAVERAERETEKVINEREKEINEKRLSFFTNISHEFRTPLTLVINPLKDLLQNGVGDRKTDQNELSTVYRNARRLLSLVDQLLLFRKAEVGADRLKITKLNFYNLCQEVYLAFIQQAKALNITYEFDCPDDTLEIYGDREKLEITLYNLLSNALKYTPQGGKVTLSVRQTEEMVKVQVTDTGYGIPKEVGDKLFDRFYQVREKNIPAKSGFGIGLFLVKYFVESHKGRISYESELGMGTTFFIELLKGKEHFKGETIFEETSVEPAFLEVMADSKDVAEKSPKQRKVELDALITENQTMLVVDDDQQIREYITLVFASKFTVYQADTAEEGLKQASQYVPDIIISDVHMLGMSGIDLCRALKEDDSLSHIPVILLTGSSSSETRLEGLEGGADDYITKPFERELLVARVANILKSRTTLQKYFYNEITLQKNPLKISEEYKAFLDQCIAIVERHFDHPNFSIKMLASELRMSQSSLYKKVKSISGQSTSAFIRFIRLRKVAELLINSNCNINEAATQVGFNDMKYFREQFFKLFGMKASDYIKKYRKTFGKSFNLNEDEF
jgi:ligand-binding sensor domain-containing protein/signal transduction histidine kinase/DNA-binding response OmpR family regulator